jgi:hypothetical protein
MSPNDQFKLIDFLISKIKSTSRYCFIIISVFINKQMKNYLLQYKKKNNYILIHRRFVLTISFLSTQVLHGIYQVNYMLRKKDATNYIPNFH